MTPHPTPTAPPDPVLAGLLAALAGAPGTPQDPASLAALTDYLSEQEPSRVRRVRLPNWLRLAWLRAFPSPKRRRHNDSWWRTDPGRLTDGPSVAMEMHVWLGEASPDGEEWYLDHWGTTEVAGQVAFVSEPYATWDTARAQAAFLAGRVGCIGVGLPRGAWHPRTARVLLLERPADPDA